ncbi:MAG TPA: DUF4832 domain-containing protein, partial [Candidatus Sulfotelmatobacter sp.]|nr:DUF4832 domain-containing protein [Candidatus Sulfotelmatobacter sp.]
SLEWGYLPLRSLMTGPTNFDWTRLEALLDGIAQRGHQAIFRVYLDYPAQPTGIPQFLLDAGLATRAYTDYGNNNLSVSPDYQNPLLRQALQNFIAAMGARYDADPRVGFITVGLLGFWGEWHTYPYDAWFASVTVQNEVLTAYERAFTKTRLLVRWPTGTNPASRRIGYHDDSFAYQTLDPPTWAFLGRLKAAGETNKWKTQPIGGEVRPEVQRCMWDTNQPSCVPLGQEYSTCVERTHASWMLNHGAFAPGFSGPQKELALAGARRLGYEVYISYAELLDAFVSGPLVVRLVPVNTGVAPFYYDWPLQIGVLDRSNSLVRTWTTPWTLSSLLPGPTNTVWSYTAANHGLASGTYKLALSVRNPLTNGVVFRFANQAQDADLAGWLTLGQVAVVSNSAAPTLSGNPGPAGFELQVRDAAPGLWTVERTADLINWTQLASTNTVTTDWTFTAPASAPAQFYRVVRPP